jgi:hypothetical protein
MRLEPAYETDLRPGDTRLFTPARTYGRDFHGSLQPSGGRLGIQDDVSIGLYPPAPHPELGYKLVAMIDGVVWADGSFSGPNRTHLLELYFALRSADHDEALAIRGLIDSGATEAQIGSRLAAEIERGQHDTGRGIRARYVADRSSAAELLQRQLLRPNGLERLRKTVNWAAGLTKPRDKPSQLGSWYDVRFKSDADIGVAVAPHSGGSL